MSLVHLQIDHEPTYIQTLGGYTVTTDYQAFLASKRIAATPVGFDVPLTAINENCFDWQKLLIRVACRRGRSAIIADCGLGKSLMELEVARLTHEHVGLDSCVILFTVSPSVASQLCREGDKFGIATHRVYDQSDVKPGINITNYDRLHLFDSSKFVHVGIDESSILKGLSSTTRKALIEWGSSILYRLCATATASPNDHTEMGGHSEFLGIMSHVEMLATFFTHDGSNTSEWILKGHGASKFWEWISTWAVIIRSPEDIGFDGSTFKLPTLTIETVVVDTPESIEGRLISGGVMSMNERRAARRNSLHDRVSECASIVNESDEQFLIWCDLNPEGIAINKAVAGSVEIAGRHDEETKESAIIAFADGSVRTLISKASVFGMGLNLQHCHNVCFLGLSDSFESFYQALRRCYRFGQTEPVRVRIFLSEPELIVWDNIQRKEKDAAQMADEVAVYMKDLIEQEITQTIRVVDSYAEDVSTGKDWTFYLGDTCEVIKSIPTDSIGYTIFSPPFESLYTFSNSERDMGNSTDNEDFYTHFNFLAADMYRITMPGRLMSFHCMNLPSSKERDGFIGIKDFRGNLIRMFQAHGWIFHSEVCIWKDPVTAMQRTKALGLLHKQVVKDSAMSRQGIPDYLVTMRKPGVNPIPVAGGFTEYIGDPEYMPQSSKRGLSESGVDFDSVNIWQRYASPVWMDIRQSRTLSREVAKDENDGRHISALQLDVIERGIQLWSMPGDTVFSPFGGIASEPVCAIKMGRKAIACELKQRYWEVGTYNLREAEIEANTPSLFDFEEVPA